MIIQYEACDQCCSDLTFFVDLFEMLANRKIAGSEFWYLLSHCMCQMSLEVDKPSHISEIVNKLKKRTLALKLKTDGENLIHTNEEITVHKIPHYVSSCYEAVQWAQKHCDTDFLKRLGTISCNDRFITLNLNHLASDGGYLKNLLSSLIVDDPSMTSNLCALPLPLEHFYQKQIDASTTENVAIVDNDPYLTRALTTERNETNRYHNEPVRSVPFFIKAEDLQCFDKSKKTLKGLTESLWTATCISAMSMNKKLADFGCSTCVNMRDLIPNSHRLDICNNYSALTTVAHADEMSTIESIGKAMRKNYKMKKERGDLFSYLKVLTSDEKVVKLKGVGTELTNVGPLFLKKPFIDAHLGIQMNSDYVGNVVSIMGSSVVSDDKNEIAVRVRYGPNKMTDKEAKTFTDRIKYVMQHIPKETKITDAISILQSV